MHERVVGLFACVEQKVKRPSFCIPLDS